MEPHRVTANGLLRGRLQQDGVVACSMKIRDSRGMEAKRRIQVAVVAGNHRVGPGAPRKRRQRKGVCGSRPATV